MWNEALWLGVPRAEIEEKKIYQGDMNGGSHTTAWISCWINGQS